MLSVLDQCLVNTFTNVMLSVLKLCLLEFLGLFVLVGDVPLRWAILTRHHLWVDVRIFFGVEADWGSLLNLLRYFTLKLLTRDVHECGCAPEEVLFSCGLLLNDYRDRFVSWLVELGAHDRWLVSGQLTLGLLLVAQVVDF